jgi:hypothetical protein
MHQGPSAALRLLSSTAAPCPWSCPRGTTCAVTLSIVPGPAGHLIQLLLDDPEPGVTGRVAADLHRASRHGRRGHRHRFEEHDLIPGVVPAAAGHCQRGPVPSRSGRRSGEARSATRTATIPAPDRLTGQACG